MDLGDHVRDIPDFPRLGIVFKDITPLLLDPDASAAALAWLVERARRHEVDLVVGIEARGLIFGGALAHELGIGFAPARKRGKLPAERV
ncbi:MAG: adenine phosphoribosyltransferase, partial [Solirubrobacterales bacterium]